VDLGHLTDEQGGTAAGAYTAETYRHLDTDDIPVA
jgi:hypothetical protein